MISGDSFQDFREFTYHLENFWLRAFAYREKICQLINLMLDLRFSEKEPLFFTLLKDSRVRESGLKVELEKFNKNKIFREVLMKRKLITHRIYYDSLISGYDRQFKPFQKKNIGSIQKTWLSNMREEVSFAKKFTEKVMDFNDIIMRKLIDYKKR